MKTGKRLEKVQALAKEKDFEGALAELEEIQQSDNLNPYERAKLWEARAGLHLAMEKYDLIPEDLQKALAENALSKSERLNAQYNLAQSLFMNERFSESADAFAAWAAEAETQTPEQQFLIASSFGQAKRFDEALPYAKKAIEGNDKAPESWYTLLASLHYELKQNEELAAVLTELTQKYPKKDHFLQLSQTYSDLGQKQKALQALEAADSKGMLSDEQEYTGLALLYMQTGNAKKGAAVLEKQMKAGKVERSAENLNALARCYIGAKDGAKAAATLEEAGEEVAGQTYLDLARLEASQGQWEKARDAAARAVVKGGLKTPGEAHLVLGVAHYNTKRKDAALISLNEAKKNPAIASCAEEWIRAVKGGKAASAGPTCAQKPIKP